MTTRKILVIEKSLPMADRGCGQARACGMIRILCALKWEVVLFLFDPIEDWQISYVEQIEELGVKVIAGSLHLKEFLKDKPSYFNLILISKLYGLRKYKTDLKRFLRGIPVIYDSEAIKGIRENLKNKINKNLPGSILALIIYYAELYLANTADMILAVSPQEKKIFEKMTKRPVELFGHMLSVHPTPAAFAERKDILFVGGHMDPDSPNTDAILYFAKEIFPLVQEKLGCKLHIVGEVRSQKLQSLASDSIIMTGWVRDLIPFYNQCRVFIAPHRFAAGIPWKVHESMAYGLPCVISQLLAHQLEVSEKQTLIGTTTNDFAEKIIQLYFNQDLWSSLRNHSLEYIQETCNPQVLTEKLNAITEKTLKI